MRRKLKLKSEQTLSGNVFPAGVIGPFGAGCQPGKACQAAGGIGPMLRRSFSLFEPIAPRIGSSATILDTKTGDEQSGILLAVDDETITMEVSSPEGKATRTFPRSEYTFAGSPALPESTSALGSLLQEMKAILRVDDNGATLSLAKPKCSAFLKVAKEFYGKDGKRPFERGDKMHRPKTSTTRLIGWLDGRFRDTGKAIYDRRAPGYMAKIREALDSVGTDVL